jgi:hypothetical protein
VKFIIIVLAVLFILMILSFCKASKRGEILENEIKNNEQTKDLD